MSVKACQWVPSGEGPLAGSSRAKSPGKHDGPEDQLAGSAAEPDLGFDSGSVLPDSVTDAIMELLVAGQPDVAGRAAIVCELTELLHEVITWLDDEQFASQETRGQDYLLQAARSHRRRMTAICGGRDTTYFAREDVLPS